MRSLEESIRCEIADILQIDDVRVEDDFFTLGGASLEAIELIERCTGKYGVELAVTDIFDAPNIRGIVDVVEAALITSDR